MSQQLIKPADPFQVVAASVTNSQSAAISLTKGFNRVTSTTINNSSILPSTYGGDFVWVMNDSFTTQIVYPQVGGSINRLGTNVGYIMYGGQASAIPGEMTLFVSDTTDTWRGYSMIIGDQNNIRAISGNVGFLQDFTVGGKVIFYGAIYQSETQSITANAAGGQASGTQLAPYATTFIDNATIDHASVKLPNASIGALCMDIWNNTTHIIDVYPQTNGSINGITNGVLSIAAGKGAVFRTRSNGTAWFGGLLS